MWPRGLFLVSTFFVGSIFSIEPAFASSDCGRLVEATGHVEVNRIVKGKSSADGSPVRYSYTIQAPYSFLCTDVVVTGLGASARIQLPSSVVALGPQTRLQLSEPLSKKNKATLLQMTFGKVRAFFQKSPMGQGKSSSFRIRTPAAVTGVRGTDFFVSYDPTTSLSSSAVLKGDIEVTSTTTGKTVVVKGGEQVQVFAPLKALQSKGSSAGGDPSQATLIPEPLTTQLKDDIRSASTLAKEETSFQSPEAIGLLGEPEAWRPVDPGQVPADLKDIENKF
jgi:hypothetical protein